MPEAQRLYDYAQTASLPARPDGGRSRQLVDGVLCNNGQPPMQALMYNNESIVSCGLSVATALGCIGCCYNGI
jgi:hypothetical protein